MGIDHESIIGVVVRAIPYPNQIKDWDLTRESRAVRFTWRGVRFRVNYMLCVDEVQGDFLAGSNLAILLRSLLLKEV